MQVDANAHYGSNPNWFRFIIGNKDTAKGYCELSHLDPQDITNMLNSVKSKLDALNY